MGDSAISSGLVARATRKVCGVLVARLQGKSWAPPPPTGCMTNVGTVTRLPSR